jgi:hypothetical protein
MISPSGKLSTLGVGVDERVQLQKIFLPMQQKFFSILIYLYLFFL